MLEWVDGNIAGAAPHWEPPVIDWLLHPPAQKELVKPNALLPDDLDFASRTPGKITVEPARAKRKSSAPPESDDLPMPEQRVPSADGGFAGAPASSMEMGAPPGVVATPVAKRPAAAAGPVSACRRKLGPPPADAIGRLGCTKCLG